MAIQINEISEKYINKLGKSYFNTVKHSDAISAIKNAVKETSEALKEEIKQAIEPLKSKIAEKDEFITSQAKENEKLTKENQEFKSKINSYNPIIKEAYKQGITQEIREKKSTLASVLSGLIHNKEKLNKTKSVEVQKVKTEDILAVKKQDGTEKTPKAKKQTVVVDSAIIQKIEAQRKNQKLDKKRLDKASLIIKTLIEDAPQDSFAYRGVQKQFKKTLDDYIKTANNHINNRYFERDNYGKIRVGTDSNGRIILKERGIELKDKTFTPYKFKIFNADGSLVEIYDGNSDSYIEFRDTNGQKLLKICYGEHYGIFINDKNGKLMVTEGIKDGVVKYLNVNFNEVQPIAEIEKDEVINAYAQRLILEAKQDCKSEEKTFRDTTDIDYINPEGRKTVQEYFVNKQKNSVPIFTYLFNPKTESIEKLISTGDFGIHGKIVDDAYGEPTIIQYRVKGITSIDKRRSDGERKDFSIGFYRSTENEHWETQSLYDKNYELDKDSFLQREVYEKFNYGIASKPLTKSFTFYDLTKHKIKPWDFSILKPYL